MTSNSAKMERRIAGLVSTFQCIAKLAENTKDATPQNTTKTLAITRLELLESNWERFQREHDALLEMNCENLSETSYFMDAVEAQCQTAYETAKVTLLMVKEHYEMVEPTGANLADISAQPGPSSRRSALPTIKIPEFDGEFHSSRPFHDLFVSLVGQNPDITAVEKMHYLRLSLTGDAARLIANLPVSSASFASAWDLLVARYENKRFLVTAQLERFFGMSYITPRSYQSLNTLINTTSEVLNALRALEMPVNEWGILLVHFIVSRLDHHLREQWELQLGASTTPATLPQLREFLTTRARALESVEAGKSSSLHRSTSSAKSSTPSPRLSKQGSSHAMTVQSNAPLAFIKTDAGGEWSTDHEAAMAANHPLNPGGSAVQACHYCLGSHFVGKCESFKQRTPQERRSIAEQRRLCFNCLGPHMASKCRITQRCRECNEKHHTLIHIPGRAPSQAPQQTSSSPVASTSTPVATSSPNEPQA